MNLSLGDEHLTKLPVLDETQNCDLTLMVTLQLSGYYYTCLFSKL